MRGSISLALLAILSFFNQNSSAFTPNNGVLNRKVVVAVSPPAGVPTTLLLSTLDSKNHDDASIDPKTPDDQSMPSAAAYDQWRAHYGKGAFDAQRFDNFKTNYLTLAGANAVAIQKARQQGRPDPSLMSLNEYGDCTIEQYKAIRSGAAAAVSSSKPPEPEVKSVAPATGAGRGSQPSGGFQMFESLEDFEHALSDFQDTEPTADKVKCAYLDWCEKYGKDMDDIRYKIFCEHYFEVEEHWKETGKEMKLNQYADFTVQEYARLMELESPNVSTTARSMLTDPDFLRSKTSGMVGASGSTVVLASLSDTLGSSSWGDDAQAPQSSSPPPPSSSTGAGFASYLDAIAKPVAEVLPKSSPSVVPRVETAISSTSTTTPPAASSGASSQGSYMDSLKTTASSVPRNTPSTGSSQGSYLEAIAKSGASSISSPIPPVKGRASQGGSYLESIAGSSVSSTSSIPGSDVSSGSYLDAIAKEPKVSPDIPPTPKATPLQEPTAVLSAAPSPPVSPQGSYLDNISKASVSSTTTRASGTTATVFQGSYLDALSAGPQTSKASTVSPKGPSQEQGSYLDTIAMSQGQSPFGAPETLNISPAPQTLQASSFSNSPAVEKPVAPPVSAEAKATRIPANPSPLFPLSQGSYLENIAKASASTSTRVAGASASQGSYLDALAGPQTPKTPKTSKGAPKGASMGSYLDNISKPQAASSFGAPEIPKEVSTASSTLMSKKPAEEVSVTPMPETKAVSTPATPSPPVPQGSYLENIAKSSASTSTRVAGASASQGSYLGALAGPQTPKTSQGAPKGASLGSYLDNISKPQTASSFGAPEVPNVSTVASTPVSEKPAKEVSATPPVPALAPNKAGSTPATPSTPVSQESYLDNIAKGSTSARVAGASVSQGSYLDALAGPQTPKTSKGAPKGASLGSYLDNLSKPQASSSFGAPEVPKVSTVASTPVHADKPAKEVSASPVQALKAVSKVETVASTPVSEKPAKEVSVTPPVPALAPNKAVSTPATPSTPVSQGSYLDNIAKASTSARVAGASVSQGSYLDALAGPPTPKTSKGAPKGASLGSYLDTLSKPQASSSFGAPEVPKVSTVASTPVHADKPAKEVSASPVPAPKAVSKVATVASTPVSEKPAKAVSTTSVSTPKAASTPANPSPPSVPASATAPEVARATSVPVPKTSNTPVSQGSFLDNVAKASAYSSSGASVTPDAASQGSYLDALSGPKAAGASKGSPKGSYLDDVAKPQTPTTSGGTGPGGGSNGSYLDSMAKSWVSSTSATPVSGPTDADKRSKTEAPSLPSGVDSKMSGKKPEDTESKKPSLLDSLSKIVSGPGETKTKDESTNAAPAAAKPTESSRGSFWNSLSKLVSEPAPAKKETETEKSVKRDVDFASRADFITAEAKAIAEKEAELSLKRKAGEKEQADIARLKTKLEAQEAEANELRLANEALDAAERREENEKLAEIARGQAREWEEIQRRLSNEADEVTQRRAKEENKAKLARENARAIEAGKDGKQKETASESASDAFTFFGNLFGETEKSLKPPRVTRSTIVIQSAGPQEKPEKDWVSSVFDFFGGSKAEEEKKAPGRGTILIEEEKKRSVFEFFVSTDEIEKQRQPGRGTIRLNDDETPPSIFSFFSGSSASKSTDEKVDWADSEKKPSGFFFFGGTEEKGREESTDATKEIAKEIATKKAAQARKRRDREEKGAAIALERAQTMEEAQKKLEKEVAEAAERRVKQDESDKQNGLVSSFFGGGTTDAKKTSIAPFFTSAATKKADAKEGTPSLSMWTQNPDGTITGFISNSKDFRTGTKITTSPVKKGPKAGTVVTTGSGSQYRLGLISGGSGTAAGSAANSKKTSGISASSIFQLKKRVRPSDDDSTAGGEKPSVESLFGGAKKAAGSTKKTEVKAEVPVLTKWIENADGTISGLVKNKQNVKDGTKITINPTRRGAKAGSVVRTGSGGQYRLGLMQPSQQNAVAGLFAGSSGSADSKDDIAALTDWKQNPDGSITGNVRNNKNFKDGTLITTSPVRKGAKAGSVVRTGAGSQYRLL